MDEERFIIIGEILEKVWSAIVTYRNDHIRIKVSIPFPQDLLHKFYKIVTVQHNNDFRFQSQVNGESCGKLSASIGGKVHH